MNIDEVYNQALEMIQKGQSKDEVLVKFAQYKNELAPLLDISFQLLTLPKNIVPTPLMRRNYAAVPVKRFWLAWIHISKFAGVSMAAVLLLSAFSVTAYQTSKSIPGSALFSLKKGGENLQLILASNQTQKASLQVAIAQQRLSDAQQIFSDPTSNTDQKTAALNELSTQTANAVAEVNTVAVTDPKSTDSHPLLTSLDSITRQQQNLLTQIKPDSQIKTAANSALVALGNDTAKLTAIKQTIAVASNAQEALAKLNADPNSVAAFGTISQASGTKITVEQISFEITQQTSIKDDSGNSLLATNLQSGQKASVVGEKNNGTLVAQQIFITSSSTSATTATGTASSIVSTSTEPQVKGASTQTASTITATSTLSSDNDKKPVVPNSTSTQTDESGSTVKGSFIIETPSPQFGN